jgi:ATP-binding cassette subfamily F protein uup
MSASQFLQHFLFTPETQYNYVYKLSGGEKRRLHLCTVLMRNPNFLVLDEPTNDLDIVTLNILEDYLQSFKGCVIVVSHDRYFMDKVVDHLLVFNGNAELKDFPGNYTDYRDWKEIEELPLTPKGELKKDKGQQNQDDKQRTTDNKLPLTPKGEQKNQKQKLSYKEQKEFEALELEIPILEKEKADIENRLASGELSNDDIMSASIRHGELNELIDEKTMRWLELSELM